MKSVFITCIFCLSINTFAQQLNQKVEDLPLLIDLKYQNTENSFANTIDLKPDLYSQIISFGVAEEFPKNNFKIKSKKIRFSQYEPLQIDLKRELRNIMHKYPGDGNNLFINAKGLKTN